MTCGLVREAIGVFQDEPSLGAAVEDLLTSGLGRFEISVRLERRRVERRRVGRESGAAAEQAPKHAPKPAAEWADRPEAPSTAYLGNDARTQAKAAIVAGFGTLGAPGCAWVQWHEFLEHGGAAAARRNVGSFEFGPAALLR